MWSTQANSAVAAYEAHELTKDFDEATATCQRASTATAWTSQGGDFTAAAANTVDQLVTPARLTFDAASGQWKSPFGIHLFLQRLVVCDNKTENTCAWVMTRPDRTKFFFDCDGYQSAIRDRNGNELLFTWEWRNSNNKPIKFLQYITDPANRQTLTLDYHQKGESYSFINDQGVKVSDTNLTNPFIIDHVQSISSISDAATPVRRLEFTYTDKGLLGELIDGGLAMAFGEDPSNQEWRMTEPRGAGHGSSRS